MYSFTCTQEYLAMSTNSSNSIMEKLNCSWSREIAHTATKPQNAYIFMWVMLPNNLQTLLAPCPCLHAAAHLHFASSSCMLLPRMGLTHQSPHTHTWEKNCMYVCMRKKTYVCRQTKNTQWSILIKCWIYTSWFGIFFVSCYMHGGGWDDTGRKIHRTHSAWRSNENFLMRNF
jgi:hypothetical protein